jgi:hypothetical protein
MTPYTISGSKPGAVVHTCNPSTQEPGQQDVKVKGSLLYTEGPCLKKTKQNKIKANFSMNKGDVWHDSSYRTGQEGKITKKMAEGSSY